MRPPIRPPVLLKHPLNTIGWLRCIEVLTVLLPRRTCHLLSDLITTAVYACGPRLRARLIDSAARALAREAGDPACRAVGRRMLMNHGYVIADYMLMARSPRRALRALMPAPDPAAHLPLRRALDRGRGAVLVSVHFGHWELGAAYLSSLGYRIRVVTGSARHEPVERHRTRTRAAAGVATEHMALNGGDGLDLLALLPALRRGEAVALLADRPGSRATVEVAWLGRPARFPAGPALLAHLTGAPLVPSILLRRPDGTYEGVILEGVVPEPERPRDDEIRRLTAAVAAAFEPWIRAHPHQWYNFAGGDAGGTSNVHIPNPNCGR